MWGEHKDEPFQISLKHDEEITRPQSWAVFIFQKEEMEDQDDSVQMDMNRATEKKHDGTAQLKPLQKEAERSSATYCRAFAV